MIRVQYVKYYTLLDSEPYKKEYKSIKAFIDDFVSIYANSENQDASFSIGSYQISLNNVFNDDVETGPGSLYVTSIERLENEVIKEIYFIEQGCISPYLFETLGHALLEAKKDARSLEEVLDFIKNNFDVCSFTDYFDDEFAILGKDLTTELDKLALQALKENYDCNYPEEPLAKFIFTYLENRIKEIKK